MSEEFLTMKELGHAFNMTSHQIGKKLKVLGFRTNDGRPSKLAFDGGYCGQIKVAYDTSSRRSVDFGSAETWLSSSIIKSYGVSAQELRSSRGDVFMWATYPGDGNPRRSRDEFRKRYPGP